MIEVVTAIIYVGCKILCFQRGPSKYEYISFKYEFPGGKLEERESPEEALRREILEELGISINVSEKLTTIIHDYPDFRIKMHCYICSINEFNGQLRDHIACVALEPHELGRLDWLEANIPVINLLTSKDNDSIA
jgi:8-oxo-dGTP diphosphatase